MQLARPCPAFPAFPRGHAIWAFLTLFAVAATPARADDTDVPYGVGDWPDALGHHRARLRVEQAAPAVWAHLPWRRRDAAPERKELLVIDGATNQQITNVVRVNLNAEFGDLLFQPPTAPGDYFVYYLPYRTEGWWAFPTTVYPTPTNRADAAWVQACQPLADRILAGQTNDVPVARLLEFQAINEFHRFDPMELVATTNELRALEAAHAGRPYLVFPEDRRHPIRMTTALPVRWIRHGPRQSFEGAAERGEFYAFQLGLFALGQALDDVQVGFADLRGPAGTTIPATALRCFNLAGTNWLGQPIRKRVDVPHRRVQPLWLGVQVPRDAQPGPYEGEVRLEFANAPVIRIALRLEVADTALADAGDRELWRHSRLRWLDSTLGLDDEPFPPYPPIRREGPTVRVLGRSATFGDSGLPASLTSSFSRSVDRSDAAPVELLAAPIAFIVGSAQGPLRWTNDAVAVVHEAAGAVAWETTRRTPGLELECRGRLECDGYLNYRLTLRARQAMDLTNLWLEIPLRREVATYMMGLGAKGGRRPAEWAWKWDVRRANSQVWIGDVHAGLSCKLKHLEDRWDLYTLEASGPYRDWSQAGQGGCDVTEQGDRVMLRAYTGPRAVSAGQELHFNFGLLITPVKPLDPGHWQWRYFHHGSGKPIAEVAATGSTIVNLHHGDALNPHINYPFLSTAELGTYTREAHALGLKVKLYYTVRELSSYVAEFWALRSLGNEVFLDGPGFQLADQFAEKPQGGGPPKTGSAWLCEHAISGYVPAWHQPLGNGRYDAAIATTGLSRWHNYYLEGLDWLVRNVGIDGLYLDGVGYDREIMKRVRKVMLRARPGCLIDFHSGNNFHPDYGLNNCANQYLELFPCVDSLWFGEGYDYNETPDYWLVEISGIPYGLFGEMLQDGGNPWRGMLYGMSNRLGWGGDPRPLWQLWNDFGIAQARMIGYWDAASPVRTGHPDVLATVYLKPRSALIALASWAKEPQQVRLELDPTRLGFATDNLRLVAPSVPGLQEPTNFALADPIAVAPGRGWLLRIAKPRTGRRRRWQEATAAQADRPRSAAPRASGGRSRNLPD